MNFNVTTKEGTMRKPSLEGVLAEKRAFVCGVDVLNLGVAPPSSGRRQSVHL